MNFATISLRYIRVCYFIDIFSTLCSTSKRYNNCTKNARTNMVCVLALNEIGLLYFSSSSG